MWPRLSSVVWRQWRSPPLSGRLAGLLLRARLPQALLHPVEEAGPALARALVLLGRHPAPLLEAHLRTARAQVHEVDRNELVAVVARLVRDREDEPARLVDLEVLALPADLASIRAEE